MKRLLLIAITVFSPAALAYAQPRPVDNTQTASPNAQASYEARYEGGLFGSSQQEKGTLSFDDSNERVVFSRKKLDSKTEKQEMFSIPYSALELLFPDSKNSVPQTGKIVAALPLPGAGLAALINKGTKYANLTFDDPEIHARGTVVFRFENRALLLGFINTLGNKAKMRRRGDAFYRPSGNY